MAQWRTQELHGSRQAASCAPAQACQPHHPPSLPPAINAAQLITSEIDEGVSPDFRVVPGCGDFGSRYYCEVRFAHGNV